MMVSCACTATAISDGADSHHRVDSAMSVNKNVTVPDGRCTDTRRTLLRRLLTCGDIDRIHTGRGTPCGPLDDLISGRPWVQGGPEPANGRAHAAATADFLRVSHRC